MAKKIEVQIVGDADSFHRALGKASDSTSRFGRIASGVGKAGFIALGVGAGAAAIGLYKAVQAGSDWNETLNKSQVIFGKSADSVDKWSGTMAEAGGISEQAALDAASMFGTFGKAAGVGQKNLDNWSESLVQAASDMASFHNADPTQVLEDIRSGLAGEVEPLRKYGILMNDATLRQEAFKMGLVDSTKNALSPNIKMLAAQKLILEKLGPAAGDFARTSGGLANQQRILKAELSNVVTELGQALLPIAVKVATFAIPLFIKAIHKIGPIITGVVDRIKHIVNWFAQLGDSGQKTGHRVQSIFARLGDFFKSNVMPIVRQLRDIFQKSMEQIGKAVQSHMPEIRRIADRVGEALKAIGKVAIPILRFALVKVLPKAISGAIVVIDKLSYAVEKLVGWLERAVGAADALKGKLDFLGSLNKGLLSDLGIDINKGLLDQAQIFGGGGSSSPASGGVTSGGGRAIQVNLHLDSKKVLSQLVLVDKDYRRQNGRSAFA